STESTNGSSEIVKGVVDQYEKGKPAFGSPASDITTSMYNGEWEALPGEFDQINAVVRLSYAANHIVVPANSSIESLEDIEGKRIGIQPPGSSPYNFFTGFVEESYGLKDGDDYEAIPLGNPDIQEGIKDRSIDVGVLTGTVPAALITELASTDDIRLISLDEDLLNDFLESRPYYSSIDVESDTYQDQDEDIIVGAFETMLLTHEDTDEELVYTVLKEIWENVDD